MSKDVKKISPTSRAIVLIIVEAIILIAVIGGVFYLSSQDDAVALQFDRVVPEVDEDPAPAEPEPADVPPPGDPAVVEDPAEPDFDPAARSVLAEHVVRQSDTLWDLATHYWRSRHLWPDLYRHNADRVGDPDSLTIGERLVVPESLVRDGELSRPSRTYLLDAYVQSYRAYREAEADLAARAEQSGRRDLALRSRLKRSKAQWLLYSATRFDENFVISRASDIESSDIEAVESYLSRFGRPALSLD